MMGSRAIVRLNVELNKDEQLPFPLYSLAPFSLKA